MRSAVSRVQRCGHGCRALSQSPKPRRQVPAALVTDRPFSQTATVYKKKSKDSHARSFGDHAAVADEDPFGLAKLDAGIQDAIERLKETVSRLRSSGGRFDPQLVEDLRVTLPGSKKRSGDWAKLADLAQVIPRGGRSLTVIMSEETYVKPVLNAIQASPYSLNPQPSPASPLELSVPLPGPTQEGREKDLDALTRAQERALDGVREARAVHHKRLRTMRMTGRAIPDKVRKAEHTMEERTQKGNTEVKSAVLAAKKRMQADM